MAEPALRAASALIAATQRGAGSSEQARLYDEFEHLARSGVALPGGALPQGLLDQIATLLQRHGQGSEGGARLANTLALLLVPGGNTAFGNTAGLAQLMAHSRCLR